MVVKSVAVGPSFERSPESQTGWHTAGMLLERGQYEQVARLLGEARNTAERSGDTMLVGILAAAQQICHTCSHFHTEVEGHWQAHEEAIAREQELQRQLQVILTLLNRQVTAERPAMPIGLSLSGKSKLNLPEYDAPHTVANAGWWQRVQSLLGRESNPLMVMPEIPGEFPDKALHSRTELVDIPVMAEERKEDDTYVVPAPTLSAVPQASPVTSSELDMGPSLTVYCLGAFRVYEDEHPIAEWPSRKGKSIFKYLLLHRHRPVTKEVLMELFWPDADPDAARNNLNVAIYGLRQALRNGYPDFSHILFQDDCYLFNPDLHLWLDVEEFTQRFNLARDLEQKGQLLPMMAEYQAAEALYQGELFEEDRYEEWLISQRQALQDAYLSVLEKLSAYYYDNKEYTACVSLCHKMLAVEPCREDAHRHLMRSYARQNHHYLALRQYHQCVEALKEELDVAPDPATIQLYERIRCREQV